MTTPAKQPGNKPFVTRMERRIIDGEGFLTFKLWENVTANNKVFVRMQTPADREIDLDMVVTSEAEGGSRIFEGNSYGAGGTTLSNINWNRRSTKTSSVVCQIYNTDSDISSTGSTVWQDYVAGNARGNQEIGGSIYAHGMPLAKDEDYLIEFENREGSAKDIFAKLSWEEPDA